MDGIKPNDLWTFLLVLIAICGVIVTFGKAIETIKKWKTPSTDVQTMLANDKRRLDAHDKELDDMREGMSQMCAGVVALLNHELHDGNSEEMERAARDINKWLINRK